MRAALLVLGCALLVGACAAPAPTVRTTAELEAEVLRNPASATALRDLGVRYARDGQPNRAAETLQRSFEHDPSDPETVYHLALVNEVLGKPDTALRLYERYPEAPTASPYRERMRGRYQWLLRDQVRQELRAAMAQERDLDGVAARDAIGVLPFNFRGGGNQFAPLGRGLAELISADLANVEGLTVVERVRLGVLLGELELAQSGAVDAQTAPQIGRLLRANRLVGGHYRVASDNISMDAGIYSADDDQLPDIETTSGAVSRLFDLQKELVAKLLDNLGVPLTEDQLARIGRAPTENLRAFTLFSRGLQLEDGQDYQRAAALYQEAFELDPGFTLAGQKAAECRAISTQLGDAQGLLAAAEPGTSTGDLVGSRSRRLNSTLTGLFVPGVDTRSPALEGQGGGLLGPIDDPPPPPGRD